jgi:hypothetical protein
MNMQLPQSYYQTLQSMPSIQPNDSKLDYSQRVLAWGSENGINSVECLRCADIKWEQKEIHSLINGIQAGSRAALEEAIIMLLKQRLVS